MLMSVIKRSVRDLLARKLKDKQIGRKLLLSASSMTWPRRLLRKAAQPVFGHWHMYEDVPLKEGKCCK